ncbi:histidine kinase dimerization/phospho-acceptor domain-containing protein [Natrinema gelatinilyticum]|uniref:histidine kinase dimerization/phospho-acceptor domain-containing protein n=1 Tax=Natrinema gelatinilyticum TaxID=2961571 RepID=UPI0020C3223B|nr:histidine kinase dimerization/phospho-acceptor domain-containing protein [Natrinema gelatinilyticum]
MTKPPATTRPRTILYVAATDEAASDGAAALENVDAAPDRSVRPATTVERVRNWSPAVDCVVFAETPTTAAGSNLLEMVDACDSTPLVLFSDPSYAATAARSADGIDGYVRRDTDDAVAHLADEIEWVCNDGTDIDSTDDAERETEPMVTTGELTAATSTPTAKVIGSLSELAACRDRECLFYQLVETVADNLDREYCWLSTVHFGQFTPRATAPAVPDDDLEVLSCSGPLGDVLGTDEPVRFDEIGAGTEVEAPFEGTASLCCVPVGDVGLLLVAGDESAAFDERDCDLLESWGRIATALLERIDAEAASETKHDRLRVERDRLQAERDRLSVERDDLAAERDRYRTLFENVPEPVIRYEIDDGQPVVRTVNDAFTKVFGTDLEAIVDKPVDEETVPPGLEHRRKTLFESLRSGERRQFVSCRETIDGVREFLLTLVPIESKTDETVEDAGVVDAETGDEHADIDDGATETHSRHTKIDGGFAEPDGISDDHAGTTREGLIVYRDVTDSDRREQELAAAQSRLETVATLVDDDVRTPLNAARGYLELAAETGNREHFAEVEDAQKRLTELIDQIVSIARQDLVVVETEPVAIHDVARRAWVTVETGAARLVTRSTENRVFEADKSQLRELFERLFQAVVNTGSEAGSASDSAEHLGSSDAKPIVIVGVTDDGFYVARRGSETAAVGGNGALEKDPVPGRLAMADGTGFGLGSVEHIADAHGWNVGVAEDENRIAFAFRGVDARDVD